MRPIHALPRVPAPIVSCPRRRAFTLIETTVVLVVAGILLAVAAPRFASFRDASGVRGAMTDLGAAFALARQTALARRAHASVVLDTAGGVVEVHSANGHAGAARPFASVMASSLGPIAIPRCTTREGWDTDCPNLR